MPAPKDALTNLIGKRVTLILRGGISFIGTLEALDDITATLRMPPTKEEPGALANCLLSELIVYGEVIPRVKPEQQGQKPAGAGAAPANVQRR